MQVSAREKFIRMSPRKMRLVVDAVRGKPVNEALTMLQFMPTVAAEAVRKAVASALANAENNDALDAEDLYVHSIASDSGPSNKRFRPRAHGRVSPLIKRSANLTVVLAEKES